MRRVCSDADKLQLSRKPFPVQRRFHRDRDRRRQCHEPILNADDRGRELPALGEDGTIGVERAE